MPEPIWPWCVMPGMGRSTELAVDVNGFGDGYVHRATRGLNPARPSWDITVPFRNASEHAAYDAFLRENAVRGFYFQPPEEAAPVFVTSDEWSMTIADRTTGGDLLGTLQTTFRQSFNPQPNGV